MDLQDIFSGPLTREKWSQLGSYLRRNRIFGGSGIRVSEDMVGRTISATARRRRGGSTDIPYKVTLIKGGTTEAPTYEVTVGWGYVCERKPGPEDALPTPHEAANMWDVEDPTKLRRFPITIGQAVYIRVEVDEDGFVNPPTPGEGEDPVEAVIIEIAADNETSVHYTPKVDDETSDGAPGYYLYKLAVLEAGEGEGSPPKLKKWLTGSHISHFQELPAMLTALAGGEGIGVILKEWSESEKAYKLRAIKQKEPVAAVPPAGEDPGSPAQAVQIRITQEANAVRIEGNGKIREVMTRLGDGSEEPVIAIDDGLETLGEPGGNEKVILIPETQVVRGLTLENPAVAGGLIYKVGLPEANEGDMLYFDGTNWVPLAAPAAPGTGEKNVLHHDGALPFWALYEEITVHICVSGTPTEYKILGVPVV